MDLQVLELLGAEVADFARLVTRRQFTADTSTREANRELLAHLTVRVPDVLFDSSPPSEAESPRRGQQSG